jgi:hypothetical protein
MSEHPRRPNLRDTPGGIITSAAFDYAVKFFQYADPKHPELKKYPLDARHAGFQAAIVVSTLIMQERRSPGSGAALHENVSKAFPPSARHRCLNAVQDLSAYLLKLDRDAIGLDAIPSFQDLAKNDDKQLAAAIGAWLGGVIIDKWTLGEADKPVAAAMARSAWTSAIMISKRIQPKG